MQMLYNSDAFAVVRFAPEGEAAAPHGGFELVDKLARREVYLRGALAEAFERGVRELVAGQPTPEALDDYIADFLAFGPQPLVLH